MRLRAASASFAVLPSATASSLTLVFSGNQPGLTLPGPLLSDHDTNLVLIRDPGRCFALAGVPGLGADYAECLANLARLSRMLRCNAIYAIGMSAGGAAALKYGTDLRAHGVLCFSTPTTLDIASDPRARMQDHPQLTALYKQDRRLGIDLAAYYRASSPRPRATLVYGENHPRDAWLAHRMAGIAGADLVPLAGYAGHTAYAYLAGQNRIGPLLERLFSSRPLVG